MKAITLWQPYASLVALGAKPYETRSWPTAYRGLLAIHAAKRWTNDLAFCTSSLPCSLIKRLLAEYDWHLLARMGTTLPLGAVVAVATLDTIERTEEVRGWLSPARGATGDFSDDRWAWRLSNVLRLPEPVPCRGAQGLWTLPPSVLERVEAQMR